MKAASFRIIPIALVVFLALGAAAARAQAPLEPQQLPPRTIFYLIWRGAPSPDARKANSLLALWDDPDFAPVRSALAAAIFHDTKENSAEKKLTPEEMKEFASLLENPFTVGYVSEPKSRAASNSAASTESRPPAWNGMFFVYDCSGKKALIAKTILRMQSQQKQPPQISQITIAGVPAMKTENKNATTYWADTGKYTVSANDRRVMEEILGRLTGKSFNSSLAQSAAYQEAQPTASGGVLEFFLRVPDLKEFAADSANPPGDVKITPFLDALRLDAVHSVSGHLAFEGSKTHVQAAFLGDPSPGTLFDLWAPGQPSPASLGFAPAEAISYNYAQVNFLGIYAIVKRLARAAFPQGQEGILDTMAQARLGMPLTDALGLFSGEFASLQTSPSMDIAKQLYFLGIRKKPETLKLIRALLGEQLASERNEGEVTFMKISLGGKQGNAGVAQWNFFNLAVTPDMILGASRAETLREALANRAHLSASAGLASVSRFQTSRAQFPEQLTGLSYFDFQRIDWPALKDRWLAQARKAPGAKGLAPEQKPAGAALSPAALGWLEQVDPRVFARYLHYSSSVSWKDAKGMHWDQWLE